MAGDDAASSGVKHRPVQRVRGNTHQFTQHARRQPGVAVQGNHVGRVRRRLRAPAQIDKSCVGLPGQQRDQLFKLAALALPANPALLAVGPAALPVQQQEAARHNGVRDRVVGMVQLERVDLCHRLGQQRRIAGQMRLTGVGEVAEQGVLGVALAVGQVVALKLLRERPDAGQIAQHHRYHHQHPVLRRDAVGQRQPRRATRRQRFDDQPVDDGHHRFAGRPQRRQAQQQLGRGAAAQGRELGDEPGRQADAAQRHRRQVGGQCAAPNQVGPGQ